VKAVADRDSRHKTYNWQQLRSKVMERDGHQCKAKGPGCTGKASHVGHRKSPKNGGSFYDMGNLRAECAHCSSVAGGKDTGRNAGKGLKKHYGGGHDQSSHGNWANGGQGGKDYVSRGVKWDSSGRLQRPMTQSERRASLKERKQRLEEMGVLPTPTGAVDFSEPGLGTLELRRRAGEMRGTAVLASAFGWTELPIEVTSSDVSLSPETTVALTSQVHDVLAELSPEFRVRTVELSNDVSVAGGRYVGGTKLQLSPWAVPMSAEERTALAEKTFDEVPDWVEGLNGTSISDQRSALEKVLRHESGHYIENQLRLRTKGTSWWRDWSNKVAPQWEAETESFFRQEFPEREMYESALTRRRNPLFYTAATHGWSNDKKFESQLRGVDSDLSRNAELFAEFVSFDLAGESFPNGDVIGAHIRRATSTPGVTSDESRPAYAAPKEWPGTMVAMNPGLVDGDGDGYVGEDEAAGIRGRVA